MSGEAAGVLDAVRDSVLGAVPVTHWGGKAFRHFEDSNDTTALETKKGRSRMFILDLADTHDIDGPMFQDTEPFTVTAGLDVRIAYEMGKGMYALNKVILQDVDTVKKAVMQQTHWSAAMQRVTTQGFSRDFQQQQDGTIGTVIVTIPFEVEYEPSF